MKKMICLLVMMMLIVTGCSGETNNVSAKISDEKINETEERVEKNFKESTPENDTEKGLKITKIDSDYVGLNEDQEKILQYFDNDYFVCTPEAMRRYPQIFEHSYINTSGSVIKVVTQETNDYELIVWAPGYVDSEFNSNDCMLLRGTAEGALFLEGDTIRVNGQYQGIETINIDGESITLPVVNVSNAYLSSEERYDYDFIKSIAKSVFGEYIEVRPAETEEGFEGFPGYIVTLDDQSNAKFSKYYFASDVGKISDATLDYYDGLDRYIEFAADLEHIYLISYDYLSCTFTLECYDKELNNIWKREFEDVQTPPSEGRMIRAYDYTENNFYIVLNKELFVINSMTGEDTFEPVYVGEKVAIKKLQDGILLVSTGKADAIMKLDLKGNMVWKTSLDQHVINLNAFQAVEERLIFDLYCEKGDYYFVLNNGDGEVIMDLEKRF